jgi:alpha-tubulin suppressor-like RCC1 family protein
MRPKVFALSAAVALSGLVFSIAACVGGDVDPGSPGTTTPEGGNATPDAPANVDPDSGSGVDSSTCERCGGGDCIDLTKDPANCGACGKSCKSDAGVSFACVASKCGNEVVQVFGGYNQACVVLSEGSAWCWGSRAAGELGTVDPTPQPKPTKIALTDVAEVRGGERFLCARTTDGSVHCWGDNTHGVLGHAPGTDPGCTGTCSATPTKVVFPNNAKIAGITAGLWSVCARTEGANGGDVYCWGDKFGGITGDTSAAVGAIQPAPVKIAFFATGRLLWPPGLVKTASKST